MSERDAAEIRVPGQGLRPTVIIIRFMGEGPDNPHSDLSFRMQGGDAVSWFSTQRPPVPSQWAALLQVGPPEPWPVVEFFEVVTGRPPDLRDPWEDRT